MNHHRYRDNQEINLLAPLPMVNQHRKADLCEKIPSIHHLLYSLPTPTNSLPDFTFPLYNSNHLKYYQEFAQGYIPMER